MANKNFTDKEKLDYLLNILNRNPLITTTVAGVERTQSLNLKEECENQILNIIKNW